MLALRARPVQQPAHGRQVPPVPSGTYSATGATECLVCGLRRCSLFCPQHLQLSKCLPPRKIDHLLNSKMPFGLFCPQHLLILLV